MADSNTKSDSKQLGQLLQRHRHAAGLSLEKLATATGMDKGTIHRIEQGQIEAPNPKNLQKLATALGTEVEDYFALAGYFTPHGLPSLGAYLRAKYDASPELAREIEDYFSYRRQREGGTPTERPTNQ
jgi:transcriptional regulator with XRE-family HTH domain